MSLEEERGWYLSQNRCEEIIHKIRAMTKGGGRTRVTVTSWWHGELRWARNRVSLGSDRCNVKVHVVRHNNGGGESGTNQLDDQSLEGVVRSAERRDIERRWSSFPEEFTGGLQSPPLAEPTTRIWSDATAAFTTGDRSAIARLLAEGAESKGMLSAGYLEMRAASQAVSNVNLKKDDEEAGEIQFSRLTQAQCSMTVRHPKGTGSGWAGGSSFDMGSVDHIALAERALEKCLSSLDPVMIEPGRYTVILEPQAVCQMLERLMDGGVNDDDAKRSPLGRQGNEHYGGVFVLGKDDALDIVRSKLGLKIVDERISISHDPADPILGVMPHQGLEEITWIKQGVLNAMHHGHEYARARLHRLSGQLYRPAFRVSGGTTTMEEMIHTTQRGLLVTRFSGIVEVDRLSLLSSGITRDGLWLIENGKITKAVKNMRFTESILFSLNQIEQLGIPVPVFRPEDYEWNVALKPAIVPPMKIRDFSFTSLVDAI